MPRIESLPRWFCWIGDKDESHGSVLRLDLESVDGVQWDAQEGTACMIIRGCPHEISVECYGDLLEAWRKYHGVDV